MDPRAERTASVLLGLLVWFGIVSAAVAIAAPADGAAFWLPRSASPARLSPVPETYFEGLSGFVVGVAPESTAALAAAGGRAFDLAPGETLYAFLLEDGERAAF